MSHLPFLIRTYGSLGRAKLRLIQLETRIAAWEERARREEEPWHARWLQAVDEASRLQERLEEMGEQWP